MSDKLISSVKKTQLYITGVGASTCFGDAPNSCAAIRAGLNAFADSELQLPVQGEREPQNVVTCTVPFVAGSESYGRLLQLLLPALGESMYSARLGLKEITSTDLFIFLPVIEKRLVLDDVYQFDKEFPGGISEFFKTGITRNINPRLNFKSIKIMEGEHAEFAKALLVCNESIENGHSERIIICGVDSLVEEGNVELLMKDNKVKLAENPAGLIPGESASVLVVEKQKPTREVDSYQISAIAYFSEKGRESSGGEDEIPPLANFFASDAISQIADLGVISGRKIDLLVDLNGEYERAKYWANNVLQAQNRIGLAFNLNTIAESVGDTGAGSGALSTVKAGHMLKRGYSKSDCIVIGNVSDDGSTGIVVVQPS